MSEPGTVCVVGLGYIGLPTAALLAMRGWQVNGADTSGEVVASVNRGESHIAEPQVDSMVRLAVDTGRLRADRVPTAADVFMICVPTPFKPGGDLPAPNLDHVFAAAQSISAVAAPGNLVIIESTCPVGTTEQVQEMLAVGRPDRNAVHLAYCPERVLPGQILKELVSNDRIVGGVDDASTEAAELFYRTFVDGAVLTTDSRTAEMVKLVENSFRDVNIAFANEISLLSVELGIDPWELIRLANRHPRVNILSPGPGVGGHCIAVDPWFIVSQSPGTARLIHTAREVNDAKTIWVIDRIAEVATSLRIAGRPVRVACLGLAYKPDVGDLRESPALKVARALRLRGVEVLAVEPNLTEHDEFALYATPDALERADLVAVLVAHSAFRTIDFGDMPVIDFCGPLGGADARQRPANVA